MLVVSESLIKRKKGDCQPPRVNGSQPHHLEQNSFNLRVVSIRRVGIVTVSRRLRFYLCRRSLVLC